MTDADLRARLERLVPAGRIGVAVSGGPDSLALLLLATAARPGAVEAATVDHRLRTGSADEAAMVADLCQRLGVPHATLPVSVAPGASVQARARAARYAALAGWAADRGLAAIATAHHADDQAETLLMRLNRGAGVGGLAGVRELSALPNGLGLVRPLLGWRKAALVELVRAAGIEAVDDPSNADPAYDRTRARDLLRDEWLQPERFVQSAAALAQADEALGWMTERLAEERVRRDGERLTVSASDLPAELQRRLLLLALEQLGCEGPRGPDVERALMRLREGESLTLGEVKLDGGAEWTLRPAPPRRS